MLKIAVENRLVRERENISEYEALEKMCKDEKYKPFFRDMAKEAREHEKCLEWILQNVTVPWNENKA